MEKEKWIAGISSALLLVIVTVSDMPHKNYFSWLSAFVPYYILAIYIQEKNNK